MLSRFAALAARASAFAHTISYRMFLYVCICQERLVYPDLLTIRKIGFAFGAAKDSCVRVIRGSFLEEAKRKELNA